MYELEDKVAGTSVEHKFFSCVHAFYETSVKKMLDKVPLKIVIKELAFLDPRNHTKISTSGIINLATRFTSFSTDEMDTLAIEFQDFRACSDS